MQRIENARRKVDQLDSQILDILAKRFEIVKQIGELKAERNLPVRDEPRESALLTDILAQAAERNLNQNLVQRVFFEVIEYGRKIQESSTPGKGQD